MENKATDNNLSLLRIMSTIAVVLLHTASTIENNADLFNISVKQKELCDTLYKLMNWSVPVFFMITGALMLDSNKEVNYRTIFTKYVKKIVLILLIFGVPFASMVYIMQTERVGTLWNLLKTSFVMMVENKGLSHFWYLHTLIAIYLILPIVKEFVNNTSQYEMGCATIVLIFLNFLLPFIGDLLNIEFELKSPLIYAVTYLFIGRFIYTNHKRLSSFRVLCVINILICSSIICFDQRISDCVSMYNSPVILLLAVSIYSIVLSYSVKMTSDKIWKLDRLCFGVYIIHPVFIQFVYRYLGVVPTNYKHYPLAILVFGALFISCSYMSSYVMNKIPIIKRII